MSGLNITLTVEGADRLAASLGAVQVRVVPTMIKTARRGVWLYAVPATKEGVARESGIGRRIWGVNPSGLTDQGLVKQGKLVIGKHEGITTLLLRGIPALLERGGQIKAHTIRNAFGRKGKRMPHPGMALRAHNFGQRALDRGEARITRDVDVAIGEMLKRHGF